jgi:hypothetical protein
VDTPSVPEEDAWNGVVSELRPEELPQVNTLDCDHGFGGAGSRALTKGSETYRGSMREVLTVPPEVVEVASCPCCEL